MFILPGSRRAFNKRSKTLPLNRDILIHNADESKN